MEVINMDKTDTEQMHGICPAIYVARNKSKNPMYYEQYTFGVVGIRSLDSSLELRFKEHEKDKTNIFDNNGGQLHRHKASPWKRLWAADLRGWTQKGAVLAEWLLYSSIAKNFYLADQSCFEAESEKLVLELLSDVAADLQTIETRGNHRWQEPRAGESG